jgi:hypothetical protein
LPAGLDLTDVAKGICLYTAGFMRVDDNTAEPLGSGTLMQIGEIRGILTAAHVLKHMQERVKHCDRFGLMTFPVSSKNTYTVAIDLSVTVPIVFGCEPFGPTGPDLAFLRVPSDLLGTVSAYASFVNFERHSLPLVETAGLGIRVDMVAGIVAGKADPSVKDKEVIKMAVPALATEGKAVGEPDAHGFDLLRFVPDQDPTLPKSYRGTSGGGLWHLIVELNEDGKCRLAQKRLIGVAFYEARQGDQLHIICHGPHGIYQQLFEEIQKRWPDGALRKAPFDLRHPGYE